MSIQVRFLTCAAILMAGVLLTPVMAFALPSSPAVAIEISAPARAEQIGWRRGWGWGVGAGVVGGVIIGRALTAPYYEPYYPRAYYPGPAYYADGYYPGRYRAAPIIEDVEDETPRLIAFSGFGHTIQKAGPISDTMAVVIPARDKTARCRLVLPVSGGHGNWDPGLHPRLKLTMNATYNCADLVPAQMSRSVSMNNGRI